MALSSRAHGLCRTRVRFRVPGSEVVDAEHQLDGVARMLPIGAWLWGNGGVPHVGNRELLFC